MSEMKIFSTVNRLIGTPVDSYAKHAPWSVHQETRGRHRNWRRHTLGRNYHTQQMLSSICTWMMPPWPNAIFELTAFSNAERFL